MACSPARAATEPASDSAVRQQIVKTLLSEGEEQQTNLTQLADTGSRVVHDVLTAWTREGVYLYDGPNSTKIPILLEDQTDADGKARAISIADGSFLKDDKGQELKLAATDLTAVDTDMKLRSAIQQTLDAPQF